MGGATSAAVGAGVSVLGGLAGANASKSAAAQQQKNIKKANEINTEQFDYQKSLQNPIIQAGDLGRNQFLAFLGLGGDTGAAGFGQFATAEFTPEMFAAYEDPGYAFRLEEGQKAIDRSAAARGGLQSGNALKAAARYGQDMGSQEYQNAYNRYQTTRTNTLSPYASLMGYGQSGVNALTDASAQYAQRMGDNLLARGNSQAAGTVGANNALMGGIGQAFDFASSMF